MPSCSVLSKDFDQFSNHVDAILVVTGQNNRFEVGIDWRKRNRPMVPSAVIGVLLFAAVTLHRESLARFGVNYLLFFLNADSEVVIIF